MKVRITRATSENWYHVGEEYDICENTLHRDGHDYHPLVSDRKIGIGVGHFEVIDDEPKFPFKVKCVDDFCSEKELQKGKTYTAVSEYWKTDYILDGVQSPWNKVRFEIVKDEPVQSQPLTEQNANSKKSIDSHYNFDYTLTEADREKGVIKVDPYFVSKQWRLGSKDDTGVLFHCLKNISRYSDKNSKEREIKALHLQIKRLAELEGVSLNEMVLEILDKK